MARQLTSLLLTAVFGIASCLGHGGLHLLPGGQDCHHAQEHAASEPESRCCHHGGHTHPGSCPQPSPAPVEHDHDNCVVCQWHAQGQITAVDVVVPLCDSCCGRLVHSEPQVETAFRLTTLWTRGPPRS